MFKKGISLLLISIFVLSFSVPAFAAVSSPQWQLRPTSIGDNGIAHYYLASGENTIYIDVKQSGIHAGEQAHTFWELYHPNTGVIEASQEIKGDFSGMLIFRDLKHVGGRYQINWTSKTNNDTQGYYQLHAYNDATQFFREK